MEENLIQSLMASQLALGHDPGVQAHVCMLVVRLLRLFLSHSVIFSAESACVPRSEIIH